MCCKPVNIDVCVSWGFRDGVIYIVGLIVMEPCSLVIYYKCFKLTFSLFIFEY